MKAIQDLLDRGVITNFTVGRSGIADKGLFCSIRFTSLEGYVQGHGPTVEAAFEAAMARGKLSESQLRGVTVSVVNTAPTMPTMPDIPVMRMPL